MNKHEIKWLKENTSSYVKRVPMKFEDLMKLKQPHLHTPYLKDNKIYFTCGDEKHLLPCEKETLEKIFREEVKKQADNKPNTA